jgi:hypothetical protein
MNLTAESSSALKRTVSLLAGFSLLRLSALKFISGLYFGALFRGSISGSDQGHPLYHGYFPFFVSTSAQWRLRTDHTYHNSEFGATEHFFSSFRQCYTDCI